MRAVQVMGVTAVLVLAGGVTDAVAGSRAVKVSACVNSHGKIVSASGKRCAKGSHSVALPTTAAPAALPTSVPAGTTLTGVWEISGYATAATEYFNTASSYTIPFTVAPQPVIVTSTTNQDPAHCKGTVAKPTAAKGFVCIYVTSSAHVGTLSTASPVTNQIGTGTKFGWGMYAASSGAGSLISNGTWAATG